MMEKVLEEDTTEVGDAQVLSSNSDKTERFEKAKPLVEGVEAVS